MNKAVTDAIDLMPPAFADGLDQWSSADGRSGQASYDGAPNAALVASDADFGDCLEIFKIASVQKLRWFGLSPVAPGCYLRVSARVKLVGGNRPNVRIAAWVQDQGGSAVAAATTGAEVFLEEYGQVYEVSAIVGQGHRTGVDMIWPQDAAGAHFGIDLTGDNNCSVRIESIRIEDATSEFHRTMMDWVDVRDFGAMGDGSTDDTAAFHAADAAAQGRDVLVPGGDYYIAGELTMNEKVRFTGRIAPNSPGRVSFAFNYDYDTYLEAFQDEQEALERAIAALYAFTDHDSLDLCGRRIRMTRPVDVHAVVGDRDTYGNRRTIRNGHLDAASSSAWNTSTATSNASYDPNDSLVLSNVGNIGQIEVGSLVTGTGVGREVYVREVDVPNARIVLSQPLYAAAASQSYTFTRFRYMLDFSGFASVNRQCVMQVEFLCNRRASAIMLPRAGTAWHIHDCWFIRPADRGITSIGEGCNGISLTGNEFLSGETGELVRDRHTIAINTNKNDLKFRNNRVVQFLHFAVVAGGGHMFIGNHWWQGDSTSFDAERSAGVVLTNKNCKTVFTGNYCDNAFIELTDEHNSDPSSTRAYGALSITGNIFTCSSTRNDFTYIRLAPIGTNHSIDGVTVMGNSFKTIGGGTILRVDGVDDDRGDFDHGATRGMIFSGNVYERVTIRTANPASVPYQKFGTSNSWTVPTNGRLPFGGEALALDAFAPGNYMSSGWDGGFPSVAFQQGGDRSSVRLDWRASVGGLVLLTVRSDRPS
ncbi:glycosyl hydrolase family 28-related protein [Roseobacter sp. HKCCA0434]|uniref:glycosyl hydrolase family 28-related protein n=1 Tax=Roseobacter sp. HKCCA0434 TaxID=3079297 RepID=UPI00290594C6|nr:glycosyl hydrolase family 28-related protein [Roseobacter sp. HKCCA0434]